MYCVSEWKDIIIFSAVIFKPISLVFDSVEWLKYILQPTQAFESPMIQRVEHGVRATEDIKTVWIPMWPAMEVEVEVQKVTIVEDQH